MRLTKDNYLEKKCFGKPGYTSEFVVQKRKFTAVVWIPITLSVPVSLLGKNVRFKMEVLE